MTGELLRSQESITSEGRREHDLLTHPLPRSSTHPSVLTPSTESHTTDRHDQTTRVSYYDSEGTGKIRPTVHSLPHTITGTGEEGPKRVGLDVGSGDFDAGVVH